MGRVLTFADPAVIRMAREDFVPVVGDDWYQRRRQDDEGEFFRKVVNQGPRRGEEGTTRQGIYMFTADGHLLGFRNHRDPAVMRGVLQDALVKYHNIAADYRKPGAIQIAPPKKVDPTYHREVPKGALVVTVFTRILDRMGSDDFCHGSCEFPGGDRSARDHLWLLENEWKSLIPENAKEGDSVTLPDRLAYRIARFHLVDGTRGEPPHWSADDVRSGGIKVTVEGTSERSTLLRLSGAFLLRTHDNPAKADRGYDVKLAGWIRYNAEKKAIDRFDVVAIGDHWGQGPYTRGARPGRTPLGIALELARGDSAADQVPPQASRWLQGYIEAEKSRP